MEIVNELFMCMIKAMENAKSLTNEYFKRKFDKTKYVEWEKVSKQVKVKIVVHSAVHRDQTNGETVAGAATFRRCSVKTPRWRL